MAAIEQSENLRKLLSLLTGYPKEIPLTYGTLAEAMRLARLVQAEIEAHEVDYPSCPTCGAILSTAESVQRHNCQSLDRRGVPLRPPDLSDEADKVRQFQHEDNMMDCPHCVERRLHVR